MKKGPRGGVLENYLWRAEDDYPDNLHIKTVVSPSKALALCCAHYPIYKRRYIGINEKGDVFDANYVCADQIRINHYYSKSKEDWIEKVEKGRPDIPRKRDMDEFDIEDKKRNAVFDDRILKVLAQYKKNIINEDSGETPCTQC